jgi:hydroxymethylpyrimidine/phosphomethylpyrimidine kinase
MSKLCVALTIAGSDPSAGAGIQVDLKTFWHHNVYGCSVITAITAQNTQGVDLVYEVPAHIIKAQLKSIFRDIPINGIKIGMVFSKEIVLEIAKILKSNSAKNIVIDPVMASSSGYSLLKQEAQDALIEYLFPLADLITPNVNEASMLSQMEIKNTKDVKDAAKKLIDLGAKRVLIKGGHLKNNRCDDWFFDGKFFEVFESKRIRDINFHGSGCILSSAIVANLCIGKDLLDAISSAKLFTRKAIELSCKLGRGANVFKGLCKIKKLMNPG